MATVRCNCFGGFIMKFDPGKAWPHPVLRPPKYGDDYPEAEFEVEIDLRVASGSTSVHLTVEFILSSQKLLRLVEEKDAHYTILITAPQTRFRELFRTKTVKIEKQFVAGLLAGWVEIQPFLICARKLPGFCTSEWHPDFEGQTFYIFAGSVLAEDEPKRYFIDPEYENSIGSIFKIRVQANLSDGRWTHHIEQDHIWISMSQRDERIFNDVRQKCRTGTEGYYLINGLYLPALAVSLKDIDCDRDEYQDSKWFASLDRRLKEVGCRPLGSEGADRIEDAQKIFESPFLKMPLLTEKSER